MFVKALTLALIMTASGAMAQTRVLEVVPYSGSEERPGDRIDEAFGQTERVTGFADGTIISGPLEGRIVLRRFKNPPGKTTLEIVENYRAALTS